MRGMCRKLLTPLLAAACGFGLASGRAGEADAGLAIVTNTAWTQHLAQLKPKVPDGFTVVVQPPFFVIGDEAADTVRLRATNIVKWAVDRLKRDYFQRDPAEIVDIWLFRDRESYTNWTQRLFNTSPASPYGFYSPPHRALIMNIATGGGTLVHEIVHPFMRANFPACPAWFNEGLASLYEQCTDNSGHLRGLVNWRYKGLESAIRDGRTISFEKLTAMTETEFYNAAGSASYSQYYAQARYLCYYLQEQGLLVKFYQEFSGHAKDDPSGYRSLQRVLGEPDMNVFQKKWEKFILDLRSASPN